MRRAMAIRRLSVMTALIITPATMATGASPAHGADVRAVAESGWVWPATAFVLERPYAAPAHRYGAGHRGIDLRLLDDLSVHSPADGLVAFVGDVAGRGVVTIDHGGGLVTTLEPVTPSVDPGEAVARGGPVGHLALGGHVEAGALHFGVRRDGEYVNPLLLLGGVPRAVLLPCC